MRAVVGDAVPEPTREVIGRLEDMAEGLQRDLTDMFVSMVGWQLDDICAVLEPLAEPAANFAHALGASLDRAKRHAPPETEDSDSERDADA